MNETQREQRFLELFQAHRARVYRLCCAYLYDRKEVEDLFQEIMVNIWKGLDQFRQEATVGTWVYRIAVNTALVYNQKIKRKRTLFQPWPEGEPGAGTPVDSGEAVERERQLEKLRCCIAELKKEDRLIMSLLLEGLSYEEIAEVVGISPNYVGVKINRLKALLARMMAC